MIALSKADLLIFCMFCSEEMTAADVILHNMLTPRQLPVKCFIRTGPAVRPTHFIIQNKTCSVEHC